jgi:hypothetical protein
LVSIDSNTLAVDRRRKLLAVEAERRLLIDSYGDLLGKARTADVDLNPGCLKEVVA